MKDISLAWLGQPSKRSIGRSAAILIAGLVLTLTQSGCLVAGYSSGGGWFLWPGSLGFLVVLLLLFFFLRRGR